MRTLYFLFLFPLFLTANPFKIDFPVKESLTHEDLLEVQNKLAAVDLKPVLDEFYPKNAPKKSFWQWNTPLATKEDFGNRISKSLHQTFINPEKGQFPSEHLVKINEGGDRCIVCYVSFNGIYSSLINALPKQLEKVGFNGYLFYKIGGFPNPTGKEIQYAGVPYCFKIFTLLEAQKKGFQKVLWIDAAFLPLKDPSPLFDWIDKHDCFLKMHEPFAKFILPKTRSLIQQISGVDVLKSNYVSAQVIGFNLESPLAKEFIAEYYRLVELGYPFVSCFPEEYVFSCIVGRDPKKWMSQPFKELSFAEVKLGSKDLKWAQEKGYFFLQTIH
jgi:hypothetical protein